MLSQNLPYLEKSKINFSIRIVNHAWLIGLSSQYTTDISMFEQVLQYDQRKLPAQRKSKLIIVLCIKAILCPTTLSLSSPKHSHSHYLSFFFSLFILQFCPVIYAGDRDLCELIS